MQIILLRDGVLLEKEVMCRPLKQMQTIWSNIWWRQRSSFTRYDM